MTPFLAEELSTIIQHAMTGDKTAFTHLVWRYKDHIVNIAFGVIGNSLDAEDIAQETFLKAYLSIGRLSSANAFYQWLVRIAVNLSIDKKKANTLRRTQPLEFFSSLASSVPSPDNVTEQHEQQRRLLDALDCLSLDQRTVLILREFQEFSYQDIALILDIPIGTVRSRISAAKYRLREILAPERC